MTDLDQLLTDTFEHMATQAPHDPALAASVRIRARRRRLAAGAALGGVAAATAAVIAVVGIGPETPNAPGPGATAAPCRSQVVTDVLPVWARAGFSDPRPVMPYVTSASGRIVGILFEPLTGPPRDDSGDKVLWVWQDLQIGGVHAVARFDGSGPPVSFADNVTGPSSVKLPSPGCWRVTITWQGGSDTIDLQAARP